mgnify:CR=1 FL=1
MISFENLVAECRKIYEKRFEIEQCLKQVESSLLADAKLISPSSDNLQCLVDARVTLSHSLYPEVEKRLKDLGYTYNISRISCSDIPNTSIVINLTKLRDSLLIR